MTDSFDSPVLVTGASGYVASWIVHDLLKMGAEVHATVRNKNKTEKIQHLLDFAEEYPGNLHIFEADLMQPGTFADAIKGCGVVMHTASPFFTSPDGDPQKELVDPALKGTQNVLLEANQTPSVQRVVLTSSVVSIYGDNIDMKDTGKGIFDESHWNTTSSLTHQPYSYSKTVAEKEAWKIYEAQSQWELSVINPAFVLGPSLTSRLDSTSINFMVSMANGTYKTGVPDLDMGIVDVRDIAQAHIRAALNASNGRHIMSSGVKSMWEVAQVLKKKFGKKYPFPMMKAPKFVVYLIGPAQGLTREFVKKNIGHPLKFDNSKSKSALNMDFRSIESTLIDQLEQLAKDGVL